MNKIAAQICFVIIIGLCLFNTAALSQETEREPFALELPELETGRMTAPRNFIASSKVNTVKFWILNPAADSIDWGKIKAWINRQSANVTCKQNSATLGKVMLCDLNRIAGFRLQPKENLFEIEAVSRDGKRFYGSFIVITDAKAVASQPKDSSKTVGKSSPTAFSGRKFAVIIGVSEYQYNDIGLGNLEFADADAEALYKWLRQTGGLSPDDILFMTNKDAHLSAVRESLTRFLSKATENDLILFFLAGHGTPDPFNPSELYYLVYDSKIADLKNTGFPMTELKRIIDAKLKSKRAIFLLDTCHSAGLNGKKVVVPQWRERSNTGERNISEEAINERELKRVEYKNDISEVSTRLFGSAGRAVLTSSDTNETSRESQRWGGGHGVFTWALLEGLRGKADANADKIITAAELFKFIREKVQAETNRKQNPRLFSSLGGELEIAVLK